MRGASSEPQVFPPTINVEDADGPSAASSTYARAASHAPHPPGDTALGYPPDPKVDKQDVTVSADVEARGALRTPSPTPSEQEMLAGSIWTQGTKKSWRERMNRETLITYLVLVVIIAVVTVFLVFQNDIIRGLKPFSDWLHRTKGAWLVPIAIIFVLSFPPLFGHGLIAIICGTVWGVWIGWGIVTAGTVLGELANFVICKWCCYRNGQKFEDRYLMYALYAQVVREGSFVMPTIMRYTSYPGHGQSLTQLDPNRALPNMLCAVLTVIFATCGTSVWEFVLAALLSSPKHLATVYLGVAGSDSDNGLKGGALAGVKVAVIMGTTVVTYAALWWVGREIDRVKGRVIYGRQKSRQERMLRASTQRLGASRDESMDQSTSGSTTGLRRS
ncbi:hypothetical protein C2E23DRAFT_598407 [Lenzites betulinus]|nr:hypothetical protein C2E23DRAFT_598407 [Lenzites betulinus]